MSPRQTALGRLLQDRREEAGYSRARVGEVVGIKPGTIEGWELGRVARPPIHDVVRLAHFLRIPVEDVQAAVFEDAGVVAPAEAASEDAQERKRAARRRQGPVPLLDAAFRLFGWKDDATAAEALGVTVSELEDWRSGRERMPLADYLALTSMIGTAAADAVRAGDANAAGLRAATEALGVSRVSGRRPA